MKINKPLFNLAQSWSDTAKAQSRANTGCASKDELDKASADLDKAIADEAKTRADADTALDNRIDNLPKAGNGKLTIKQGDAVKGTFTANQSGDTTIDLDAGGGSDIDITHTQYDSTLPVKELSITSYDDGAHTAEMSVSTGDRGNFGTYTLIRSDITGVPVLGGMQGHVIFSDAFTQQQRADGNLDLGLTSTVEYSGAMGGADRGPASLEVSTGRNMDRYQIWSMDLTNTSGNHGTFYLVPSDTGAGLLHHKAGKFTAYGLGTGLSFGDGKLNANTYTISRRNTIWDFAANVQTLKPNQEYATVTPTRRAPTYYDNVIPANSYVILSVTAVPKVYSTLTGSGFATLSAQAFEIKASLLDDDADNGEVKIGFDTLLDNGLSGVMQQISTLGACSFYTSKELHISPVLKQGSIFTSGSSSDTCKVQVYTGAMFIEALVFTKD